MSEIELWGGPECTVNRTWDVFRDQSRLNGHHDRVEDLDLFAALGVAAVRYPVLWERVSPDDPLVCDWEWSDIRLRRLRELDIRPIAGLVHHGGGPRYTDLLDDEFAAGLGAYAGQVAQRYPWIEEWTPVNEPLTTARFSALYGHWYPHRRDEGAFWRALLNQIDGTRAAMRAIRAVNPTARLIQTDDLGRTYATTRLVEQAGFDNLRRWAGWDLLFGRITPHHPLWERMKRFDLTDRLRAIAEDPCPPDVVGVNHYLTSDRFLDHRLDRYPPQTHGGNDHLPYADVEAIRVIDPAPAGLAGAVTEAWQRYGTPIAVTEVHNGCTREEQLRWAAEAWDTATALRTDGIDVRAVTAWSIFGSHDWNTLLTARGVYEAGVYEVTADVPRATALAKLWRGLPSGAPRHPVVAGAGWWRRPERLLGRPAARASGVSRPDGMAPLLICGATGTLGQAFAHACRARGIDHRVTSRATLDLADPGSIATTLSTLNPWGVINAAGWVRVDDAETMEADCHLANATGAIALAEACAARGIACVNFSSDLVFDGGSTRPYVESDAVGPLNAYGRSKVAMEAGCAALPGNLVVRTAAFFSGADPYNFAVAVLDSLAAGRPFVAAADQVITPTYVPALVDRTLDLLIDEAVGLWHISSGEAVSWAEFAARIAVAAGADPSLIVAVPGGTLGQAAPRPRYVPLQSERGGAVGQLDAGIALVVRDHRAGRAQRNAA